MSGILVAGGAIAALFASTVSAGSAPAAAEAPPEGVRVGIETVNGSGCPAGTVGVSLSPDRGSFTVNYSEYLARVGAGADPTGFRKNCQLVLNIGSPAGWTYAVSGLDHSGYAHLERGATGEQNSAYYFQGSSGTTSVSHDFTGPYDDEWQTSDSASMGELVWAPCGEQRFLNVNTELRVDAGSSDAEHSVSFLAMRSTDVPATTYHLTWKRC
ncbi:DUF4360 domain-containing protein [Streptomyces litchfieldiae]|uniref:DUF4360 domain-containing protein n=1 Tax=Streptomyces litchfieldiae TaxID=3075543 RepID=A0ABU2MWL3_9ACTN|nr:DUF4360 domain-containing protein [Streptomyces sp. DSM 44938]MDT0345762.1 DUF4360 domain-containing protein [Streptomyces sp. DSM 44938]